MTLYRKLYASVMLPCAMVTLAAVAFLVSDQRSRVEWEVLSRHESLTKLVAAQAEAGLSDARWPLEALAVLAAREEFRFWWIVTPQGLVQSANDAGSAGARAGERFPNPPPLPEDGVGVSRRENLILFRTALIPRYNDAPGPPWSLWVGFGDGEIRRRQEAILLKVAAAALLAMSFLGCVLFFTIGRFIVPIQRLTEAAEEIGRGNLRHRIAVNTKDEVGILASAINEMVRDLQNILMAKDILNHQMLEEIENRKHAESALTGAYHELKTAQSQLVQAGKLASIGELAAGVAHELNQPLMVIRASMQLLPSAIERGTLSQEEILAQLRTVERNTGRMTRIIDHLRHFSRQSTPRFAETDIAVVIEDAFLMVTEQLRLRDISVQCELEPGLPRIQANAQHLEQVFLNLITNARDAVLARKALSVPSERFRGAIYVTARRIENDPDAIEILVSDNGTGIPPQALHRVFDPFFTTKEVGSGTGLGLSISYGIVQEHGGRIRVAETSGAGTTFSVILPVKRAPDARAEGKRSRGKRRP